MSDERPALRRSEAGIGPDETTAAAPPLETPEAQVRLRRAGTVATRIVVVAMIAGTTIGLSWAERARRDAREALAREAGARQRAEAMQAFLRDVLASADSAGGGRRERTIVEAMQRAAASLDQGAFADQPDVEIGLRYAIGTIFDGNGRPDQALLNAEKGLAIAKRVHPGDDPRVAEGLRGVALARNDLEQFAAAEPVAREALAMARRLHPGGDLDTARDLMTLAGILSNARHYAEAAPLYHEAADMRRAFVSGDDRDLARSVNDEGVALTYLGRFVEAGQRFDAARAMRERLAPADDPDVAESLHNVAWNQERQHRPGEAEANYRRALDMYRRVFAGDHRSVSRALYALGWNVMEQGRWAEAERLLAGALDMTTRLAPDAASSPVEQMSLIGTCELLRGQVADAERWYARSLAAYQQSGGAAGVSLPILYVAGMVYDLETIDPPRAVAMSAAVYARAARTLPADSPAMFDDRVVYASALLASGGAADLARAESLLRRALSVSGPTTTSGVQTAFARSLLGGAILRQAEGASPSSEADRASILARLREAEPLVVGGFDALASLGDTLHPYYRAERLAGAAGRAARLYDLWNRLAPDAARAAKAERYVHDAASYGGQSAPGT